MIQDYEGALLMYSYASILGMSRGSYGAGFLYENNLIGNYKCKLGSNYLCASYYYLQGVDYYKSKTKLADILYWKFE